MRHIQEKAVETEPDRKVCCMPLGVPVCHIPRSHKSSSLFLPIIALLNLGIRPW